MLYSTKRKWEKLISNNATPVRSPAPGPITTTTTTSPSTPTTDSKKPRIDDLLKPSLRAVSPAGSLRSVRTDEPLQATESPTPSQPTFVPWDRDAFLERLASFRFVDKWQQKPAAVNEVVWAKRGWVCCDKNRVRCVMCRKEVLVGVEPDDELSESGRGVVEKYAEMIVSEHDESCLWKQRGCDDTIYRIHLANSAIARPAFTKRYLSLSKIRNEIPPELSYPPEVDQAQLHYPSECSAEHPISGAAAIMAMFGWQNDEPGVPSLVTCSACFRRLGLWLFQKRVSTDGEASVARLDVITEHRDYCPWINAASQGKEPGWQTLLRMLRLPPKGHGTTAGSVFSASTYAPTETSTMTDKDREEADESKLKRLKALKKMYFGKTKADRKMASLEIRGKTKARQSMASERSTETGAPQEPGTPGREKST